MDNTFIIESFWGNIFFIIAGWLLLATAFWSWGNCISKLLKFDFTDSNKPFLNIFLGFISCIFFFSIYNLVLPINYISSLAFYLPGIIYFLAHINKKSWACFKKLKAKHFLFIIFLIGFVAVCAIQKPICFDSGLYHFNTIRWANEYPIVKGLANLHSRFGFNQLYFLYIASLNFHPYLNTYGFHLANSFLLVFMFLWLYKNSRPVSILLLLLINFLPTPFFWISAPTPDVVSGLLLIFLFCFIIEYFYYRKNPDKSEALSLILIISCFSVTMKLSNAFFILGIISIFIYYFIKQNYPLKENSKLKRSFAFIAIFMLVWIIRGYVLSGYPLFPSTIGKIGLKWTVPENITNYTQQEIYAYARLNKSAYKTPIFKEYVALNKDNFESDLLNNYTWIKYWVNLNFFYDGNDSQSTGDRNLIDEIYRILDSVLYFNTSISFAIQVLLSLAGIIAFIFIRNRGYNKLFLLIWISCLIAIFAWFLTAPAIRFTNGIAIIWLCTTILLLCDCLKIKFANKSFKNIAILLCVLAFIWHFNVYYSAGIYSFDAICPISQRPMTTIKTNSGLIINVPVNGAQVNDCQLPATPLLDENLSLLGDSITDGFAISDNH